MWLKDIMLKIYFGESENHLYDYYLSKCLKIYDKHFTGKTIRT